MKIAELNGFIEEKEAKIDLDTGEDIIRTHINLKDKHGNRYGWAIIFADLGLNLRREVKVTIEVGNDG